MRLQRSAGGTIVTSSTARTDHAAAAAAPPGRALAKALSHPLRWQILALLAETTTTPAAIARELGVRIENVSYHVRVLSDLGLIELVRTTPVRGALEHHYRACPHVTAADTAPDARPLHVRRDLNQGLVRDVVAGLVRAFAGDAAHSRCDGHLSRTPIVVDEEGWREIERRLEELRRRVREIEDESRARRARGGPAVAGEVVLLHYPSAPAR